MNFKTLVSFLNEFSGALASNVKQTDQIEKKLANIKEVLASYEMTFNQILDNLSLNQLSISDLRNSLLS